MPTAEPTTVESQYPAPSLTSEPAIETPAPAPADNTNLQGADMIPNEGIREDGQPAETAEAAAVVDLDPIPAVEAPIEVPEPAAQPAAMSVMPAQSEAEVPEETAQAAEPEVPGPTTEVDSVPAAAEEQKPSFISRLLGLVGI
jgi:hypothetical protein